MVKILALGDIMLGDQPFSFGFGIRSKLNQGKKIVDEEVIKYLSEFDLVIGNLESPLCPKKKYENDTIDNFSMRGDLKGLELLKKMEVNVVSIANNHIMEHGDKVFENTLTELDLAGVVHIGSKKNPYHIFNIGSKKVALLGWSMVEENFSNPANMKYNFTKDYLSIVSELENISEDFDYAVLSLHWGSEFVNVPSKEQIETADNLLKNGFDLIIGHHPHVLQPIVKRDYGIVAFSMGNFIFDYWMNDTNKTGIIEVDLEKMENKFIPCEIDKKSFLTKFTDYFEIGAMHEYSLTDYNKISIKKRKNFRLSAMVHFIKNLHRYQKRSLIKIIKWGFNRILYIISVRKLVHGNPGIIYLGPRK